MPCDLVFPKLVRTAQPGEQPPAISFPSDRQEAVLWALGAMMAAMPEEARMSTLNKQLPKTMVWEGGPTTLMDGIKEMIVQRVDLPKDLIRSFMSFITVSPLYVLEEGPAYRI